MVIDKCAKIGKCHFFFYWDTKLLKRFRPMQKRLIIGFDRVHPYKRWGFTWLYIEFKNVFNLGNF